MLLKHFQEMMNIFPEVKEVKEFNPTGEYEGIKAITYDGVKTDKGKTKVFAYIGYPSGAKERKSLPAVVLVHGGGGEAYLPWVKMWTDKGYVAIAMSTTGDFPLVINAGMSEQSGVCNDWYHGLCGIFKEEGYVNAPENDEIENSYADVSEHWLFHAVSQVILAGNVLRKDSFVDSDKIGIAGISWGGIITSIAIGYDNRFAFAVPIYGSGYLLDGMGGITPKFYLGRNQDFWLAEKRFEYIKMPVLWLCWNKDLPFSANSNSMSYIDTVKNNKDTRISMVHEMYHCHTNAWWRKEALAFADSVCQKGKRFPTVFEVDGTYIIDNPDMADLTVVKLYYITEKMSYKENKDGLLEMCQDWIIEHAECENGKIICNVTENAVEYYFELTTKLENDDFEYVTTSQLFNKTIKNKRRKYYV